MVSRLPHPLWHRGGGINLANSSTITGVYSPGEASEVSEHYEEALLKLAETIKGTNDNSGTLSLIKHGGIEILPKIQVEPFEMAKISA